MRTNKSYGDLVRIHDDQEEIIRHMTFNVMEDFELDDDDDDDLMLKHVQ